MNICREFEEPNLKINRDHLHSKTNVCVKFDETVNSVSTYHPDKVWSMYQNVDDLCDLTLDRLISKSTGIIYTLIKMSVPNLRNQGQFCV